MSDWSTDVPGLYMLISIHIIFIRGVLHYVTHTRKAELTEKRVFILERNRLQKLLDLIAPHVLVSAGLVGIWTLTYYRFLSESATLICLIAAIHSLNSKRQYAFSIDNLGLVTPDKRKFIPFKKMVSIHFASDYIEIWSKYIIQYRAEISKNQLGDHWHEFRSTLYQAVKDKDNITVTATTESLQEIAQLPRSSP